MALRSPSHLTLRWLRRRQGKIKMKADTSVGFIWLRMQGSVIWEKRKGGGVGACGRRTRRPGPHPRLSEKKMKRRWWEWEKKEIRDSRREGDGGEVGEGRGRGAPLCLSRIKSNSPYRTLFEEVIGCGNAVTRGAAAERFPCLPMLAGVIANQQGKGRRRKGGGRGVEDTKTGLAAGMFSMQAGKLIRRGGTDVCRRRKLFKDGKTVPTCRLFLIPFGKRACVFYMCLLQCICANVAHKNTAHAAHKSGPSHIWLLLLCLNPVCTH